MSEFELRAEVRNDMGTGAMRRLRRTGRTPAIIYGAGKETIPLSLSQNELKKQLSNEALFSHILTVTIGSDSEQVVLKDLQRDPATYEVTHLDLQRVVATKAIQIHVPVHLVNEEKCLGKRAGGMITRQMAEVEVSCLPKDLPEFFEVDVSQLEIGDAVHLSELRLPEGVELVAFAQSKEQDRPVVSVQPPARIEVEEEVEAVEAAEAVVEGEEEPAEGAPEKPAAEEGGE